MLNREIYQVDPTSRKLVNEGVANVNDDRSALALEVLRYELETFVCDGQYEKGLRNILDTFLKNVERPHQPGVWVSGFFGSGKSHLVKMLRALWQNTPFPDGATSRGIAKLPASITDLLRELDTQGKRHGGLHAASGTLSAGAAGSVRLALLGIIFKSKELPQQYPTANFVMWMQKEGILEAVKAQVADQGDNWQVELGSFHFSGSIHAALSRLKPDLFPTPSACLNAFSTLYGTVVDISNEELLSAIKKALTREGRLPLTAIIIDEVQQFIGEDTQKSIEVQEVVETCSKNFGGKLLFIGTGQTALAGTPNLKKLEGRFTVRVELSDADVDAVIRQVVLAKKPQAVPAIDQVMQKNIGEIGKHLSNTSLRHRQEEDSRDFAKDYPILPVRRRFWEHTLRVLDQTGTDSQLRNQLAMTLKAICSTVDMPLGTVISADYLFFELAEKMLQAHILPRKVYDRIMLWRSGDAEEKLVAGACALVFLINKLAANKEIGIRSDIATLADLLVTDVHAGSASLRSRLAQLLDEERADGKKRFDLLVKIQDEYRIQTEESESWNNAFINQKTVLSSETYQIETRRDQLIREAIGSTLKNLSLMQGKSKVARPISISFEAQLPADSNKRITVWVRNGWSSDESSFAVDARQAGNESPTIFLFVPIRSSDDLRRHITDAIAARRTLDSKGAPNTPEGLEARSAVETILRTAETMIRQIIGDALESSRVIQAGGQEISARSLREAVLEAAENSCKRLFPSFAMADDPNWAKVYEHAQKGSPDALRKIGHERDVADNPVCKEVLNFIGSGKKGSEIRKHFENEPYGWSGDAVDGALQALLVANLIKGEDERQKPIIPARLERKALPTCRFRVESTVISSQDRLLIRKLFSRLDIDFQPNAESASVPAFLNTLRELAERAGGEPPKPVKPSVSLLDEIATVGGNDQLQALVRADAELNRCIDEWRPLGVAIAERFPAWQQLNTLVRHAESLENAEVYAAEVAAIEAQRSLLADPNPIPELLKNVTQLLRESLNEIREAYAALHRQGLERLQADPVWALLSPEERHTILSRQELHAAAEPKIEVKDSAAIIDTLAHATLRQLRDKVAALSRHFDTALVKAVELKEPDVREVQIPRRTLRTPEDIDTWVAEVKKQLTESLKKGPIVIQ